MFALLLAAALAQTPGQARAVGRVTFRNGDRLISAGELRRALSGARLAVDLRRGTEAVTAELDEDGSFVASLSPGSYRIEYLRVGDRAEFFNLPAVAQIAPGESACIGTFTVDWRGPVRELGLNRGSAITVEAGCEGTAPSSRTASLVPPPWDQPPKTWIDYAVGFRVEGGIGLGASSAPFTVAASYLFPYPNSFLDPINQAFLIRVERGLTADLIGVGIGGGLTLLADVLELQAGATLHMGADAATPYALFGQIRIGTYGFGISVRAEAPGPRGSATAWVLVADVSPGGALGWML